MPVKKKFETAYAVIVGAMENKGKSPEEAKDIADRAIKSKRFKNSQFKKYKKGK